MRQFYLSYPKVNALRSELRISVSRIGIVRLEYLEPDIGEKG